MTKCIDDSLNLWQDFEKDPAVYLLVFNKLNNRLYKCIKFCIIYHQEKNIR